MKKTIIRSSKIIDGLTHLNFNTQYDLTSTMMRIEEFYESPYKEINGKYFTVEDYMDAYAQDNGNFTYNTDWNGFNVTGESILRFFKIFDGQLLQKEERLKEVIFNNIINNDMFYVIADHNEEADNENIIDHEIAHGLFYLNSKYKNEMLNLINAAPKDFIKSLSDSILGHGYHPKVILDEMQAYCSTSSTEYLTDIMHINNIPEKYLNNFIKTFKKYYK